MAWWIVCVACAKRRKLTAAEASGGGQPSMSCCGRPAHQLESVDENVDVHAASLNSSDACPHGVRGGWQYCASCSAAKADVTAE